MPIDAIGNISLPKTAFNLNASALRRPLKGGLGDESPGRLIDDGMVHADELNPAATEGISAGLEKQFQDRPWLILGGAAALGALICLFCGRR